MAANHETLLKYWASVINEANSSGEKLITWMERNGIDRGRFYYWHKLVKEAGLIVKEDNAEASGNLPSCMPGRVPVVAEIRLSDNNKSDRDENAHFRSQIMIQKKDFQVYVGNEFSSETLGRVMEVLERC